MYLPSGRAAVPHREIPEAKHRTPVIYGLSEKCSRESSEATIQGRGLVRDVSVGVAGLQ